MEFIFPLIWMLGAAFSIYGMTMHLKGHHADTKMMRYKEKGDELQTYYSLCQKGYTYQIFMCNDPLQQKKIAKRMLPLHLKVMFIFDTVDGKHHQRAMDNIYISGTFFKAAYNYEKITDSWCYTERSERHSAIRYTRIIEVK